MHRFRPTRRHRSPRRRPPRKTDRSQTRGAECLWPAPALIAGLLLCLPIQAAAEPFLDLPNGSRLYNSGIDLSGGIDQRFEMTVNPYAPGSTTANLNSGPYLSPNDANSAWIGPAFVNVNTPESVYRVRTLIDLTGVALSDFSIRGFWVSDNLGLDILVNGQSTGFTNNGSHTNPPSASPANAFTLDASTGLIAGVNVVEFEWGNGPAGGAQSQFPNPTHVRIEFTGASYAVPMSGPMGLGILVAALGIASRWHLSRRFPTPGEVV